MGLLDVLNGMQNGPRGPSAPSTSSDSSSGGGMSPITMAIMALLAWKAVKHFSGGQPGATAPDPRPAQAPPLPGNVDREPARRSRWRRSRRSAQGRPRRPARGRRSRHRAQRRPRRSAQSIAAEGPWRRGQFLVSNGPNKQISPGDLANALGADQIDSLASQSGLSRDQLLQGLSQYLPDAINHLTPDGRLPSGDELHGRL